MDGFDDFILRTYGLSSPGDEALLVTALSCDAAESGFDLSGLQDRLELNGVSEIVMPSLALVIDRTKRQAAQLIEEGNRLPIAEGRQTVGVCDLIARKAYGDKRRRSGKLYYSHPKEAAAMVFSVLSTLEREGVTIDPGFKDAVICAELLHDASEESVRSCKYYDPNRPESFSPLLVRSVFDQTNNPYGQIVANTLRLMTHYQEHPWAPTYDEYVSLASSDFMSCLVKAADMYHNHTIDPKKPKSDSPQDIAKIADKRFRYARWLQALSVIAPSRADRDAMPWAPAYFKRLYAIQPSNISLLVEQLDAYVYA